MGRVRKYIPLLIISFVLLALIFRPEAVKGAISAVSSAISPFVTGIILAAIIAPAVNKAEHFYTKRLSKKAARTAAVFTVYLAISGVIAGAAVLIFPRLWESAALFVNSVGGYYGDLRRHYGRLALVPVLDGLLAQLSASLPKLFDRTFAVTADFFGSLASFFVGAVLSVYILAQKEALIDFVSSAAKAAMPPHIYEKSAHITAAVNSCLVSFIAGQLTEAVVLGTLCFGGMVLFRFEYPLLISSIIAVTALVPVVGAIAGAVPSALILFLAKPSSALWFLVFIIILQQLENNFIYPKVVGKSVGLPPILIFAAIIIGAKLDGAAGIMLGIPLMSAAYMLIKEKIGSRL